MRKYYLALLVFAGIMVFTACGQTRPETTEDPKILSYISNSMSCLSTDPAQAEEWATLAIKTDQGFAMAYVASAWAEYLQGKFGESSASFLSALKESDSKEERTRVIEFADLITSAFLPSEASALFAKGNKLIEEGNSLLGFTFITNALKYAPYNSRLYYEAGYALIELGQYETALAYLNQSLYFNPCFYSAYIEIIYIQNELGRYELANGLIESLGGYFDLLPTIYIEQGYTLIMAHREEEALAAYEKCVELYPDYSPGYYFAGMLKAKNATTKAEQKQAKKYLKKYLSFSVDTLSADYGEYSFDAHVEGARAYYERL